MKSLSKEFWAYAGMVILTLIIGLSFIFVKIALESSNPIDLLAHRFTAGAIAILILFAFGIVKLPKLTKGNFFSLVLLSIFYPLLFFGLQTFGLQFSSASEAGIIFAISPVLTLVAASLFLNERTTAIQKIGILLSVFGILYIVYNKGSVDSSRSILGSILLLLSVCSVVAYYVLIRKLGSGFDAMAITLFMTLLAFLAFNAVSLVSHFQNNTIYDFVKPLYEPSFIWAVLYLGILSSVVTSFLSNYALAVLPASTVGVFGNLSPVISILGGVLILNETLYAYHFVGGSLVLIGVIGTVAFRKETKPT